VRRGGWVRDRGGDFSEIKSFFCSTRGRTRLASTETSEPQRIWMTFLTLRCSVMVKASRHFVLLHFAPQKKSNKQKNLRDGWSDGTTPTPISHLPMLSGLRAFLLSQSVDDVGIQCVKLEMWLGAAGLLSFVDLVLAIAFAGCERQWSNEILVALVWLAALGAALVLPLQRRTRAMPLFSVGIVALAVLTFAWQIYMIVLLAQGKVVTGGAKACLALLFVVWLCRFVTIGFIVHSAHQVVRVVPNNRLLLSLSCCCPSSTKQWLFAGSRNTVIEEGTTAASGAYVPPQISPAEPAVTL